MIRVFAAILLVTVASSAHAAGMDDLNMQQLWKVSVGARLYDNWFAQLLEKAPPMMHPSYPEDGLAQSERTWRCVECHGWDYRGRDVTESDKPPMPGVINAGKKSNAQIDQILRNQTHRYTRSMISDENAEALAMFLRYGLDNFDAMLSADGKASGDTAHGKKLFNFTCMRCHGKEGTNINLGSKRKPRFIGTFANTEPPLLLHKIRYGEPGTGMLSFGEFVERVATDELLDKEDAIDVLSYAQTLPQQKE